MDHPRRAPRRQMTVMMAVVACATLLASCAASAHNPTAQATDTPYVAPTITPAPTPLTPAPLTWRAMTPPRGVSAAPCAVAPSDAATAYACQIPDDPNDNGILTPLPIWATHDFGVHWTRMASVPADKLYTSCAMHVDQFDPSLIVVIFLFQPRGAGGGPDIAGNWASFNGGASWRNLASAHLFGMDLNNPTATRDGLTYAIRGILSNNAVANSLWVSSDHMATWRSIDPPGFGAANSSTFAVSFWMSPATGEMIAVYGSEDANLPPTTLWDTRDSGAHWTQLTTPGVASLPGGGPTYLAWLPTAHASLTICSATVGLGMDDQSGAFPLFCSQDGGKTWITRPNINPMDAGESMSQEVASVFAIASDGSLLASLSGQTSVSLYRLAPNASQWQSLGDAPGQRPAFGYSSLLPGVVVGVGMSPTPLLLEMA